MTLEELRLRVHVLFPDDEVAEVVEPDGSARFEVNPPGDRVVAFWNAGNWEVWRIQSGLEGVLTAEIEAVSAHQLIAARRRLDQVGAQ